MPNQLRIESRKLITTPRWWGISALMVVASVGAALLLTLAGVFLERSPLNMAAMSDVGATMNSASGFTYVVAIVLGVIIATADQTDGTLALSIFAARGRSTLYGAKVLVATVFGLLLALVTLLLSAGAVTGVLIGADVSVSLTSPEVLGRLAGGTAVLTLWVLIGVGIGAVVRNALAAIVAVVVISQVVEPVIRSVVPSIGQYFPGAIAEAASGGSVVSLAMGASEMGQTTAAAIMVAFTAIVLLAGAARFHTQPV